MSTANPTRAAKPCEQHACGEVTERGPTAWMVALSSRRIVVVREGGRHGLAPAGDADDFPSGLQPGDPVVYKGKRETVLAVLDY